LTFQAAGDVEIKVLDTVVEKLLPHRNTYLVAPDGFEILRGKDAP
jgi:hypothetical protein